MRETYPVESRVLTLATVNGDSLNTLKKQVFLDIYKNCIMSAEARSLVAADNLVLTVDLVLVITEDHHRWRRLLKTFEKVQHFRFLLDVFNLLDNL